MTTYRRRDTVLKSKSLKCELWVLIFAFRMMVTL